MKRTRSVHRRRIKSASDTPRKITLLNGDSTLKTGEEKEKTMAKKKVSTNVDLHLGGERHAKLCHLLVDIGTIALRQVFNQIFPPLVLKEKLAKTELQVYLRRLRSSGLISEEYWFKLYPKHSRRTTSEAFDATLLFVLLKNICHLSAPYPNGWTGKPLDNDMTTAANIVRLQHFRKQLVWRNSTMTADEFIDMWSELSIVLLMLGGDDAVKPAIEEIFAEKLPHEHQQVIYDDLMKWNERENEIAKRDDYEQRKKSSTVDWAAFRRPHTVATSKPNTAALSSSHRRRRTNNDSDSESTDFGTDSEMSADGGNHSALGMPAAERQTLVKFYKQLTANVKPGDVIDHLMKMNILSMQDKQLIYADNKNHYRMDTLLDVLVKKSASAFTEFCRALKLKHNLLHEQMMKTYNKQKKKVASVKPDAVTQLSQVLHSHYKSLYQKWMPIPWLSDGIINIKNFFLPPVLATPLGDTVSLQNLFDNAGMGGAGRNKRILITGMTGTGKTTLCQRLTYDWATLNAFFPHEYPLLISIDLKTITGSIRDYIRQQLTTDYNQNANDIWQILETNQNDVIFMLDGYDELSVARDHEIYDLIERKILPDTTIVMTTKNIYKQSLNQFKIRLTLKGFEKRRIGEFIKKYSALTKTPIERFFPLHEKIHAAQELTLRKFAKRPLFLLYMCAFCLEGKLALTTETMFMEQYVVAMQRMNVNISGETITQVRRATKQLQQVALSSLRNHKLIFDLDQNADSEQATVQIHNLGFLRKMSRDDERLNVYYFTNKIVQDFFVAMMFHGMKIEDLWEHVPQLINDPWFHNVCRFLCGLRRKDTKTDLLKIIFTELSGVNRGITELSGVNRGITELSGINRGITELSGVNRGITELSGVNRGITELSGVNSGIDQSVNEVDFCAERKEGQLMDYQLSLECLHEIKDNHELTELVANSLPAKIIIKNEPFTSSYALIGFARVIKLNSSIVREIDLTIDYASKSNQYALLELADVINGNDHVVQLTINWVYETLFGQFLARAFNGSQSIKSIRVRDESDRSNDDIAAQVCADLQNACRKMNSVERFEFVNSKNGLLVNNVVRNLPKHLEQVNLSYCVMTSSTTKELCTYLERTVSLKSLNLSSVKLEGMTFAAMVKGLRSNLSLIELNLSDISLDDNGMHAFGEALSFNHSLEKVDLSRNAAVSKTGYQFLANALENNRKLRVLRLADNPVSYADKQLLLAKKNCKLQIEGISWVNQYQSNQSE
ncbi:uncharacterized protein LOC141905837 [Tubulanus polymorphus]|uniref:uncharacterized protein LOC141905837 n=1 Tax=Tubulanus polymorphus TaxID=672921 RepID=UPI003DA6A3A7